MACNAGAEFVERKEGNQIIHVRGDSDSLMNSLFDSVLKKQESTMPLQVPLHMRKLPKSFFNPPSYGSKSPSVSHSRTSSTDSTQGGIAPIPVGGALCPTLPIQSSHMRAHSSPATLQQTYVAAQQHHHQQQQQQSHLKQHSFDFVGDGRTLPPGWEQACTSQGQVYYINHVEKTTTWEDPRKKLANQAAAAVFHGAGGSPVASSQNLTAANNNGQAMTSQQLQQQLQQLTVTGGQALGPLPDGWAQAETDEGEMYFINHLTRTTSWFDPRIPERLQRPAALQSAAPGCQMAAGAAGGGSPGVVVGSPQQQQQQQQQQQLQQQQRHQSLRVQQLKLESERLRICKRQVMKQWVNSDPSHHLSRPTADENTAVATSSATANAAALIDPARQQQQQRQMRAASGSCKPTAAGVAGGTAALEPFLSSNGLGDFHARQESTDSGVGLNGNYSVPQTPDNLLSPIDDNMDHTDSGVLAGIGTENNVCPAPNMMVTPELSNLDNMDSDDLMPSIQQLGSGSISEDMLLNDVTSIINANRIDNNHTWL